MLLVFDPFWIDLIKRYSAASFSSSLRWMRNFSLDLLFPDRNLELTRFSFLFLTTSLNFNKTRLMIAMRLTFHLHSANLPVAAKGQGEDECFSAIISGSSVDPFRARIDSAPTSATRVSTLELGSFGRMGGQLEMGKYKKDGPLCGSALIITVLWSPSGH